MPFVEIKLWKGRTDEKKKDMIREVTAAVVESIDCPIEHVSVVVTEYESKHWGKAGVPGDEIK